MSIIKGYTICSARSNLDRPIADATHELSEISFIVVRIRTRSGITGEGYLLSFQYSPNAIVGALRDVGEMIIGENVFDTTGVFEKISRANEYFGMEGVNRWAQAVFNIAMWDAWCRELRQPIWKVLGSSARKIPAYGSGGWLSYSIPELIDEVEGYRNRGFRAVKVKVGKPDWREDLERLQLVREAVGEHINIMMDANQGMTVADALALADAVRTLKIRWFEEPIDHTDFDGYKFLRSKTGISMAMGEREYSTIALRELLQRSAIDIWQPDILRLGGVEAWRSSAALAGAFNVPVLPHYYKDYDVPLLCTVPNAAGTESFDWIDPLIDHPVRFQDGFAMPGERPGWGFNFKEECLTEIR